jgi:DNA polymerase-1
MNKLVRYFEKLKQKPTLLIDGMNSLIRYTMTDYYNINGAGEIIGGIEGCLKNISFLIREFRPKAVFWIADGGYLRKTHIMKEYKNGRKLEIHCKAGIVKDEKDTKHALNYQLNVLASILPCLKVRYVYAADIEADDVIGVLSEVVKPNIIVSTDTDFLQLHNFTTTFVYNPQKHKILEDTDIKSYGNEYAVLKSIVGDKTDNIKGIDRVGWKTLLKWKQDIIIENLETLKNIATKRDDKIGKKILLNYETIKRNYELICLKSDITCNPELQKILLEILSSQVKVNYSEAVTIAKKEGLNLNLIMDNAILFSMLT